MEVWLKISQEEVLQHPKLYEWLLELQHKELDGHEFVFDFDSESYKIRPTSRKAEEAMLAYLEFKYRTGTQVG